MTAGTRRTVQGCALYNRRLHTQGVKITECGIVHSLKSPIEFGSPQCANADASVSTVRAAVLLALLTSVFGVEVFRTMANSPFVYLQPLPQRLQSITIDGHTVPEGSLSNPCKVGISCWQPLTDKQFAILSAGPVNETGIIILVPAAGVKLPTAVIVKNIGQNSQVPSMPTVVGKIVNLDINTTAEREVVLLYSEDIKDTIVEGSISKATEAGPPDGRPVLHIPYLDEAVKGQDIVLQTGHIGNSTLEYTFIFNASTRELVRMVPVGGGFPPRVFLVSFSGEQPLRFCKILIFTYSVISFLTIV
ncbi:hypothetical protein SprV_0702299500 [Sparganum proliferum]